jgi:protein SDA1
MLGLQDARGTITERRVDPSTLLGKHKARKDKAERMAMVLEGREGREFGAAAARKKKKAGGLSNKQKAKRKNLPDAARAQVWDPSCGVACGVCGTRG